MMDNRRKTICLKISLVAIFGALSLVCTAFLPLPISLFGGQGYMNFSDIFIFIISALISPVVGGLVGALSGALSDLIAGYAQYALFTAAIKLIEGIIAGYIFKGVYKNLEKLRAFSYVGFYIGGIFMTFAYFGVDYILYGFSPALLGLPMNFLQGFVNATIAIPLVIALKRVPFLSLDKRENIK